MIKGYKVFNPDWTCRNKQYTCPGEFEEDVTPVECESGMHFCEDPADCFRYYQFNPENHVCEVEAYGDIDRGANKVCTNKLRVIREIPWDEVLRLVNTGKDCTGLCNTGNWNTGNWNTGNRNTGNRNTGNWNTGDWNTGDWNTGYCNTDTPPIRIFNKETDKDRDEIVFPDFFWFDTTVWVSHDTATDAEKKQHKKEIEVMGGFLKEIDYKEAFKLSYKKASKEDREKLFKLPNFDPAIFKEISGIDTTKEYNKYKRAL